MESAWREDFASALRRAVVVVVHDLAVVVIAILLTRKSEHVMSFEYPVGALQPMFTWYTIESSINARYSLTGFFASGLTVVSPAREFVSKRCVQPPRELLWTEALHPPIFLTNSETCPWSLFEGSPRVSKGLKHPRFVGLAQREKGKPFSRGCRSD